MLTKVKANIVVLLLAPFPKATRIPINRITGQNLTGSFQDRQLLHSDLLHSNSVQGYRKKDTAPTSALFCFYEFQFLFLKFIN